METLKQIPFLAIILGDHQPTEADREKLRQLYAGELGPTDSFEFEHFLRYHRYGEMPTPNDEAVRRHVGIASKQVAVMIPQGSDYTGAAPKLRQYVQHGVQLRVFFRP